ncbi:virulence-associated protein 2 [Mobiluncus mulieris]|nr:virulence-associated protein 2 [Mobiluncus mulieris]NMX02146.1 virulence-associated protein 2 [Mobiluncus mulieris]
MPEDTLKEGAATYTIAFDLEQDTLSKTYGTPTYTNAHTGIQILRIEDNNNLMPAIEMVTGK